MVNKKWQTENEKQKEIETEINRRNKRGTKTNEKWEGKRKVHICKWRRKVTDKEGHRKTLFLEHHDMRRPQLDR